MKCPECGSELRPLSIARIGVSACTARRCGGPTLPKVWLIRGYDGRNLMLERSRSMERLWLDLQARADSMEATR